MKKVKAIYIGERALSESRLGAAFKVGDQTVYFKTNPFLEIGREYWLEQTKMGFTLARIPEAVDENRKVENTKDVRKWRADEMRDQSKIRKARAARKAAKNPELKEIARRLARVCDGLGYFEIAAVAHFLIDEATKKI